jgi:hypothetical protein
MNRATRIRFITLVPIAAAFAGLVAACASESPSIESTRVAEQKIVYGAAERQEIGELTDPQLLTWAAATGTFFDKSDVNCDGTDCALTTKPHGDSQGGVFIPACPGEPYIGQPEGGHCTGFLVAPDLVATAGHCFAYLDDCERQALVFGFIVNAWGEAATSVPQQNVFHCKEVIARATTYDSLDGLDDVDFALLRLDRPVESRRRPLSIRDTGIVPNDALLVTIGSPMGLPLKYASDGSVRINVPSNEKFGFNLDACKGNSGSPIIDEYTGAVEGILSEGPANDWVYETQPDGTSCYREQHCDENTGCPGKRPWILASRIKSIVEVLEGRSCYDKIQNGQETDVDCGGPDCKSCMMGKTCEEASDCHQFPYDCREAVCQNNQCVVDYGSCGCETDADCDDHIACTQTVCNTATYSCQEISNTCECSKDTDCDDGKSCTRDTCSPTTRACVHDSSACEPQCTEDTAIDLGSNSNVVTVRNNACVRVRDHYPSWWGRRTMQLMSWSGGTYPVPFTWKNTCAASSGSGTFTANWQSKLLSQTSSACATLISLKGNGSGNISLVYY